MVAVGLVVGVVVGFVGAALPFKLLPMWRDREERRLIAQLKALDAELAAIAKREAQDKLWQDLEALEKELKAQRRQRNPCRHLRVIRGGLANSHGRHCTTSKP